MKSKINKRSHDYLRALISKPLTVLWLGGVLFLIVASLIPQAGLSEIESGFGKDKIARIIVFSILAFYPAAFFSPIRMGLLTSTSIAPLGFLLEVFQKYVPGRNFSPEDMIANNVGAVVGILLALAIRFFFRTGRSKKPFTAGVSETRFTAIEDDKPREKGVEEELTKTPKKSWKSKLIIFCLLMAIGYIVWVTFMQNKSELWGPAPTQPSPAKTAIRKKVQINTGPDHPIRYRPRPDHSQKGLPKAHISGKDLPVVSPLSQSQQPEHDKKAQPETENIIKPEVKANPSSLKTSRHKASQPPPTTTPEPDAVEDLHPLFSQTTPRTSPEESPSEKKGALIDKRENDSHEPAITPEIEMTPEKDSDSATPAASANPKFSLRLGAFLEKKNAEGLVSNLKRKGYEPYIFQATDAKNRTWHAVHLSDHDSLDAAAIAAAVFRDKEKTAIIITHKDSLKPVKDSLKK